MDVLAQWQSSGKECQKSQVRILYASLKSKNYDYTSNFLVKTIPLYSEGDVSTPHVVINYLTRSLFFILLKFPPNWKLIKVKEIKDRIFIKNLDHKMTMGLMEAKRIVDELTIEYDMNNIYRIRLVEQPS